MLSLLPKPKNQLYFATEATDSIEDEFAQPVAPVKKSIPPYGKRSGWVPRSLEDYGDGGAFPEIHVAQYPHNMGRKKGAEDSRALTLQVDGEGGVKYDSIAKVGHSKDRVVHSKLEDMKPKDITENDPSFEVPDDEEIRENTLKTQEAIEKRLNAKIKAKMPKEAVQKTNDPTFVRYTPSQQGEGFNSGAKSRVVRMVEVQKDPLDPPSHKHKKIPRGPPSPPPPVLHSPPRKVSVQEQNDWKIPPCISNWKNPKGYTIPLDKRLAADGRGLQESYINDNFAKLSQALVQVERQATEELRIRAEVDRKITAKKNMQHEEQFKAIAQQAREEKLGRMTTLKNELDEDELEKVKEREEIRSDKRKEIERELRLSKMSAENRTKLLARDGDRDITEKIALGLAKPSSTQEYDQRLFNKSQGVGSGFGDDESYGLYDKPLFSGNSAGSIYNPKKNVQKEFTETDLKKIVNTERFVPDKGFQGAGTANKRDGPVEFEAAQEDIYGLDEFLKEARHGKKAPSDSKQKGGLEDRSSSSRRSRRDDDDDDDDRDSKRRR